MGLLRLAAHASHGHARLLRLGLGELDVVPAALLGQDGQDHADDAAVVGGVDAQMSLSKNLEFAKIVS